MAVKIRPEITLNLWFEFFEKNKFQWLTILSNSMEPLIQAGDRVLVNKITSENISIGNVVVYKKEDRLIAHRIIKRSIGKNPSFIEKGDNSSLATTIYGSDIIGRISAIKKKNLYIDLDDVTGQLLNLLIAQISRFSRKIFILRSKARIRLSLEDNNLLLRIFFGAPNKLALLATRLVVKSYLWLILMIAAIKTGNSVPDNSLE